MTKRKMRSQAVRLDYETSKALNFLALDLDVPAHSLILEGIATVFERRGRPITAYLKEKRIQNLRDASVPAATPKPAAPHSVAPPKKKPETPQSKVRVAPVVERPGQSRAEDVLGSLVWPIETFCRDIIGVHRTTLYRLPEAQRPRTFKVGTRIFVSREAGLAWIREREAA